MANKKIVDVAKPDSTPADATSKPVIVGHKSMVADPMVNETSQENAPQSSLSTSATGKKLVPVSEDSLPQKDKSEGAPSKAASQNDIASSSETSDETSSESKADNTPPAEAPSSAGEHAEEKDETDKPEEGAEDERQIKLKELIESKKYNVTFPGSSHNSGKAFFITVLVVLLLGTFTILLLDDAGIIDLGLQLPFDLIQ